MLTAVNDREGTGEGIAGGAEPRRVYPPHEVQDRLGVSASGLRRLAGIYERSVGPLPRDERGRVWPEESIEVLEEARAAVREQRAISIEAALRGQEMHHGASGTPGRVDVPEAPFGGLRGVQEPAAAILEELRALRELVEEQNRRIGELEEAVRTGRELPAAKTETAPGRPEATPEGSTRGEPHRGPETAPERPEGERREGTDDEGRAYAGVEDEARVEGSSWRRVRAWFGF